MCMFYRQQPVSCLTRCHRLGHSAKHTSRRLSKCSLQSNRPCHCAAEGTYCAQEAERVQRMDKKLSSLHLDGLVDFSEAEAKFIVLGSTKKHYTVTLSDARHTCQCVDFRCCSIAWFPPATL